MIDESPIKYDAIVLETAGSVVSRVSDDVVLLKFKTDQLIVRKEAIEIDNNLCLIAENRPHYFIIDAIGIQSNMNSEALKYFAKESEISKLIRSCAILVNSLPIRITASIFIKFHKPTFKTAIFKDAHEANNWFDKLRNP